MKSYDVGTVQCFKSPFQVFKLFMMTMNNREIESNDGGMFLG